MTENEQIQEMATALFELCHEKTDCSLIADCEICRAERLYSKGYRKVERGEWIKDEESIFAHRYRCSVCAFYRIGAPTKHCPNCGADMRGEGK